MHLNGSTNQFDTQPILPEVAERIFQASRQESIIPNIKIYTSIIPGAKISIPKDPKLVVVEWLDAYVSGGWSDIDDVDHLPTLCHSVGWLVVENDTYVTIVPNISKREDLTTHCLGQISIPRGCIVKMTPVNDH